MNKEILDFFSNFSTNITFAFLQQLKALMKISFMSKWSLLLMLFFGADSESFADYFKWEILVFDKGHGTERLIIPVTSEGKIKFADKKNECRMESFWMRIEADLLSEGKTLVCVNAGE